MDVSEPARALVGGLTVPILRTLSHRSTPLTAAQLARTSGQGTEAGLRRALERLTGHGLLRADPVGGRLVYSVNYDHILWPAVEVLLKTDRELPRRLTACLTAWEPAVRSAVLFGSAARRDGDEESDVDLLLVRPPLRTSAGRQAWARQVHELREAVRGWTGNRLHVLDWNSASLARNAAAGEAIVDDIVEDGVLLCGTRITALLGRSA